MKRLIAILLVALSVIPSIAHAAITFVAAGAACAVLGTSNCTPTMAAGLQANDLILVLAGTNADTSNEACTLSVPSGYTQRFNVTHSGAGEVKLALFYKIAAGGEGNPTIGDSGCHENDPLIGQIAVFRGVDTTTPFVEDGTTSENGAQANIGAISGITIAANNFVLVVGIKQNEWTSVATLSGDSLTWAEIGEPDTSLGTTVGIVWDYAIDGGSGTTVTDKTFTVTGGSTQSGLGKMIEIAVSGGAAPSPVRRQAIHF